MRRIVCLGLTAVLFGLACDDGEPGAALDLAPPTADQGPNLDQAPADMAGAGPARQGAPCERAADCLSGFCIRGPDGAQVCSGLCDEDADCPAGWICGRVNNTGADSTLICLPEEGPCAGVDLQADPDHCGECENACAYPEAEALCVAGQCQMGPCRAGAHDLDGDPGNGCEYPCTVTRGGEEACDTIDNDCDGLVDEGFDLQADVEHCGACGERCQLRDAVAACVDGACAVAECAEGRLDADGDPSNGCEAGACQPVEERCNGLDDDCDGNADEGFDWQTDAAHCGGCGRACALAGAVPACVDGACAIQVCQPGFVDLDGQTANGCEYTCAARGDEGCDGRDDDCDGRTDEGFDLASDPAHCGACGVRCDRPGAVTRCDEGACALAGCSDGFVDLDGDYDNGCEYACAAQGDEVCDGEDHDCDGQTDEGFDLQADPSHCGRCGRVCAYAFGVPACVDGACQLVGCAEGRYDLDRDPANGCEYACVPAGPEVCNGRDDDCDGQLDEAFDVRADVANCGGCGVVCAYPNGVPVCVAGQCRLDACAGAFVDADADPANGCECAPAGAEVCDGADQDCDGRADEGFDLSGDPANCGRCGNACGFVNAEALCSQGQCRMGDCEGGFVDADQDARNGCECEPAGPEVCNGADDDCDGRADEGFDLGGDVNNCGACGNACAFENAEALCAGGVCRPGDCAGDFVDADGAPGCECLPAAEACDQADNDCDGRTDEDFDTNFDGENCGACGQSCLRDNAWTRCDLGLCVLRFCDEGFVDADGSLDNGCEVNCAETPDVPECGAPIEYPGSYDVDPQLSYGCFDIFAGELVVDVDVRTFDFIVAGGRLDVTGAPALMFQQPAPAGADFQVRGVLPGGDFGCTESYTLRGTWQDADTWAGVFEVQFAGLACDFTDCDNQVWQVSGARLP